jgi:hypothetical protein
MARTMRGQTLYNRDNRQERAIDARWNTKKDARLRGTVRLQGFLLRLSKLAGEALLVQLLLDHFLVRPRSQRSP